MQKGSSDVVLRTNYIIVTVINLNVVSPFWHVLP